MVDNTRYYAIIWRTMLLSYAYGGYTWYYVKGGIKTDCTAYLMCMIAETMFYEKGV